jgi:predicted outer membrane protein
MDAGPGTPGAAPGAPQVVYVQAPPTAAPQPIRSGNKGLWVLVIILLALAGTTLDLLRAARQQFHAALNEQAEQVLLLKRRADSSDLRYAQLSGEFRVTAEKLGLTQAELTRARRFASRIEQEQKQSVTALNAAISKKASAQQLQALQSQSAAQLGELSGNLQKGLAASQDALSGAKTELTGAIAHTHSELVALAHRTDRDYFEFALNRRGAQEKIGGGLQVQLIRTNPKMNLFTVDLFFDDKRTQRKNQSIDSPVFFYMQGASNAIELVVNKIGKNAVRGYVSTPKGFIVNGRNVLSARPTA